nr:hypothetical protein [Tanacetum cinerariifolium]
KVTAYENCISQLEKFQDDRMEEMNDKFDKLDIDLIEMALHLEERFYPHFLTTISGRRWLLTYGLELAIAKCLNSTEYLSTLGAVISKAIEKGMQDGLSAGITHGAEGRVLTDVAAYNPSAEADYLSALQHSLAEELGLTESQPHVADLAASVKVREQEVADLDVVVTSVKLQNDNLADQRILKSVVEENDTLLKAKDEKIRSFKVQLLLKEAEAAKAIHLRAEASNFEVIEKSLQGEVEALKERNNILKKEKSRLDLKVADLAASVKVREQEVA